MLHFTHCVALGNYLLVPSFSSSVKWELGLQSQFIALSRELNALIWIKHLEQYLPPHLVMVEGKEKEPSTSHNPYSSPKRWVALPHFPDEETELRKTYPELPSQQVMKLQFEPCSEA